MPANVYECMFLLDNNKVGGDVAAATKALNVILERNNAEVLASRPWDDRKLAYPIKNHRKGLYYLLYFRTEGKNVVTIERDFSLTEMIVRTMILHIDPKLVDILLQLARDEHAPVLQTVTEQPADEMGMGQDDDRRGPPRGGRRTAMAMDDKDM